MQKRQLGACGLVVSAVGLGCMGMSDFYGAKDDIESEATLLHAIDAGLNFFDTADSYGSGLNESFIGRCIRGRRDEVIIATKFGHIRDANGVYRGISGHPEYVRAACDASLARLNVDVIDLYYQHRVDRTIPIEDTVGAMAELVKAGKVRYIGLSEASAETICRAHVVHPLSVVQSELSLWSRDAERNVLPTCRRLDIGFVAYSPLGRGFLTGKLKQLEDLPESDYRRGSPRFQAGNFERNLELIHQLEELALKRACTPAQLALAWVLARQRNVVPIIGTKRRKFLEEDIRALDIQLSPDDLAIMSGLFPLGAASGARYNEWGMTALD